MAQVELYVRQAGHPERRYLVASGITQLGRADDSDIVLSDLGVSRRHARILREGERVSIEDLGSGNGTWYRGDEIERQVIEDGDEVQIDPFVLVFRYQTMGAGAGSAAEDEDDKTLRAQIPAAAQDTEARLVVLSGHRLAATYAIPITGLSMGRSEARDVVLFDPGASRNHLRVEIRSGGYWMVDLGSANGTFLNGSRVKEHPLMPGDRIRIGATEFRLEITGEAKGLLHKRAGPTLPDPDEQPWATPLPAPRSPPLLVRRSPSRMEWAMAIGVIAGLLLVIVTGVIVWRMLDTNGERSEEDETIAVLESVPRVAMADLPDPVQDLLAEGQLRYYESDYYEAAENFRAVNLDLEQSYEPALWLERTTQEAIVFDMLRRELLGKQTSSWQLRSSRRIAVSAAEAALASGEGHAEARRKVIDVQRRGSGAMDQELVALKAELDDSLRIQTQDPSHRSFRSEMASRVQDGNQQLDGGHYRAAIVIYQSVVDKDSGAETHSFYDAKDGIELASKRMGRVKERAWSRAAEASRTDDDATAAAAYREILRVDPDDAAAAAELAEVEKRLSP